MYGIEDIKKVLPHREPFLMIDKVLEVDGMKCKAVKAVSGNEWFFMGHFEKTKVMPGVLQVEAISQAGGFALLNDERMKGKLAYLARIKSAKFSRPVVPGDILEIEAEITDLRDIIGTGKGIIRVNGKIACKAEIMFAIGEENN